jgi:hypothetical protein
VNEYDEKLNTYITKEDDQRSVLIIGGIKSFLPSSQVEASISVEVQQQNDNQQRLSKKRRWSRH